MKHEDETPLTPEQQFMKAMASPLLHFIIGSTLIGFSIDTHIATIAWLGIGLVLGSCARAVIKLMADNQY